MIQYPDEIEFFNTTLGRYDHFFLRTQLSHFYHYPINPTVNLNYFYKSKFFIIVLFYIHFYKSKFFIIVFFLYYPPLNNKNIL